MSKNKVRDKLTPLIIRQIHSH